MGWVFLEILAALAVAALIVWWTMPRRPRGAARDAGQADDGKKGES